MIIIIQFWILKLENKFMTSGRFVMWVKGQKHVFLITVGTITWKNANTNIQYWPIWEPMWTEKIKPSGEKNPIKAHQMGCCNISYRSGLVLSLPATFS